MHEIHHSGREPLIYILKYYLFSWTFWGGAHCIEDCEINYRQILLLESQDLFGFPFFHIFLFPIILILSFVVVVVVVLLPFCLVSAHSPECFQNLLAVLDITAMTLNYAKSPVFDCFGGREQGTMRCTFLLQAREVVMCIYLPLLHHLNKSVRACRA